MIDQGASDSFNDCHNALDYDDSDVLTSNHLESHSFKENNNAKNRDNYSNFYVQIERLSNEKILIQNDYNSKIIDLQAQIMKLTNNYERIETSKTELEVELTKSQKELRQTQRSLHLKSNELETLKLELSNQFKSVELDFSNKISHANSMNKALQEQLFEEKKNSQSNQDFLSEKVNQLFSKIKEKEEELSKNIFNQSLLQKTTVELEFKIGQLTKKVEESEQVNANNSRELRERDKQIDILKMSEMKLKGSVLELTSKINEMESKMFEENHELKGSKYSQNNLQSQLFELQQIQINKEKEYNILLDKVCNSNKSIKDLEEALNNQIQISNNYHDYLKKFENKHKIQNFDMKDQNENLFKKISELEERVNIQNRIIEETNEELSSSREGEGAAISNLNLTIEELDKLIEDQKNQLKSPMKPPYFNISPKFVTEVYNDSTGSVSNSGVNNHKIGDNANKSLPPNKRIIRNVKQIIRDFQEQISNFDCDRLENFDKIQSQDKEIKNLKIQVRKYVTQNKAMEIDNKEKQNEIESLTEEISKLKYIINTLKNQSNKNSLNYKENIENLKNSLSRASEESNNMIEDREKYLQTISTMIKEALQNNLPHVEWSKISPNKQTKHKTNLDAINNDSATQTNNLELSGNLTGTFCFSNQGMGNNNEINKKPVDKHARVQSNIHERKPDSHPPIYNDEKKKYPSKKGLKITESKKESYIDSATSWPALREVISNELSSLLNRYDVQRAQCRIVPSEHRVDVNCHNLMTELSNKESIISRLLSYQNSNSFANQVPTDSTSRDPQENDDDIQVNGNKFVGKGAFSNQSNVQPRGPVDTKKKKVILKSRMDNASTNMVSKRCTKLDNHITMSNPPCCCGDNEALLQYSNDADRKTCTYKQESNNNIHQNPRQVNWKSNESQFSNPTNEVTNDQLVCEETDYNLTSEYAASDFEVSKDC